MTSTSKESSLVVELNSSNDTIKCQQTYIAPPRHVFFIRFFRYPKEHDVTSEKQKIQWANKRMMVAYRTPVYSCPLEIVSHVLV